MRRGLAFWRDLSKVFDRIEREESSGSHKLLRALQFSEHSGFNTIKFSRASPAPPESAGLSPAGNDDGFAERSLIFLLADRLH